MKLKNIIFGILILVVFTQIVSAITIGIEVKDSFTTGDKISFNYTILSDATEQIEYIVSANCPNAPIPLLEIKTAALQKGISFNESYIYMDSVSEQIGPQICKAIISIISPEEISEEKTFKILANPSFQLNLFSCKDQSCSEKVNVFIKGTNVYLSYDSDISDLNIESTLIFPNGKEQQINLPASIKTEQIGTYNLDVSASKEGYKTQEKNLQFGVIASDAYIEHTPVEEIGESPESEAGISKGFTNWILSKINEMDIVNLVLWGILIIGGIVILVSIVIAIMQRIKNKSIESSLS